MVILVASLCCDIFHKNVRYGWIQLQENLSSFGNGFLVNVEQVFLIN